MKTNQKRIFGFAAVLGAVFLFGAGCGGSSSSSGGASATNAVTIDGNMSLVGSSGILGILPNLQGVISGAATPDIYTLYCVTFKQDPSSCSISVNTSGVFSKDCTDFGGITFGCFVQDQSGNINPLVVDVGALGAEAGDTISLTVDYDPVTGVGTVSFKVKSGRAVVIDESDLADLGDLAEGVLYDITPLEDDIFKGAGPGKGSGPGPGGGPVGVGPGPAGAGEQGMERLWAKLLSDGTSDYLLVSNDEIADTQCRFSNGTFAWNISDGSSSQTIRIDSISHFQSDIKAALDNTSIVPTALFDAIMRGIDARLGDRFGRCTQIEQNTSQVLSADNCAFGYINPKLFEEIRPEEHFKIFENLSKGSITEISKATHVRKMSDYDSKTQQQREVWEAHINISSEGFQFMQPATLVCNDPFQKRANQYHVIVDSSDVVVDPQDPFGGTISPNVTLDKATAIAQISQDDQGKQDFLDREGCSSERKSNEKTFELLRMMTDLLSFSKQGIDAQQCEVFFRDDEIARLMEDGTRMLQEYNQTNLQQGILPVLHNTHGIPHDPQDPSGSGGEQFYESPDDFDPNRHGKFEDNTGFGGSGKFFDPALLEIARSIDENSTTFTRDMAEKYIRRFMPPFMALVCDSTLTGNASLKQKLADISTYSCFPRNVRIEPVCELESESVGGQGGFRCEDQLIRPEVLAPAAAHDLMKLKKSVPAPFFLAESLETHVRHFDDGSGKPKECRESFGVRMDGELKNGITQIEAKVCFNSKNTCNDKSFEMEGSERPADQYSAENQDSNFCFKFRGDRVL